MSTITINSETLDAMLPIVAHALRERRAGLEASAAQVGETAGVSHQTVLNAEAERDVGATTLAAIVVALGGEISISWPEAVWPKV